MIKLSFSGSFAERYHDVDVESFPISFHSDKEWILSCSVSFY